MVLKSQPGILKRYLKWFWNRHFVEIRPQNLDECLKNQDTLPDKTRHYYAILLVPILYYFYSCYNIPVRLGDPRQFDEYLPQYFDLNAVSTTSNKQSATEIIHTDSSFITTKPTKVISKNSPIITSSHIIKLNVTKRRKGQLSDPFTVTKRETTATPIPVVKPIPIVNRENGRSMVKRQKTICYHNKTGLGPIAVDRTQLSLEDVDNLYPEVKTGGHYVPPDCFPSNKIAIFVPIKNRVHNLAVFLNNIHPFLFKQNIEYRIFVIEQYGWEHFNKGRLYNAAFMEAQKFGQWKCYVFHDVDLLPLDSRILYSCPTWPRHMSATIQDNYNKPDPKFRVLFGGVTAMTGEQFKKVNGYSNAYWGWGGEDHDMFWRLRGKQLNVVRYNRSIAVYSASPHKKGAVNPYRYYLLTSAKLRAEKEGLNTVDYKLINTTLHHLYTHILIDVNPYKENIKQATVNIIKHYLEMGVGLKLPKRLL